MHSRWGPTLDVNTVLGKAVTVLDAFGVEDDELSLAELVRRTGLAKSSLHRVLTDLVNVHLLDRSAQRYRLSGHLFELGMRASVERGLLEVAIPFMQDLYGRTHETVHLGVREGIEVVYVGKIGGHRQASMPSRIGGRMPLHCTAIGKVLLAFSPPDIFAQRVAAGLPRTTPRTITAPGVLRKQLERVTDSGVAYEYEESTTGVVCVAAPILDTEDRATAALSVTGPVSRFKPEEHANSVRAASAGIAATLARRALQRAMDPDC